MNRHLRKRTAQVVMVVSMVGTLVLSLDRFFIDIFDLYSGLEIEARCIENADSLNEIRLSNSEGNLNCTIELAFLAGDLNLIATAGNDITLMAQEPHQESRTFVYKICAASEPGQQAKMFRWVNGDDVVITDSAAAANLCGSWTGYWQVNTAAKGTDSSRLQSRRSVWTLILIALLSVTIAAVGANAWLINSDKKSERPARVHSKSILELVIDSTHVGDAESTDKVRWILSQVLFHQMPLDEALRNRGLEGTTEKVVWFRGRSQFIKRLREYRNEITKTLNHLGVHDE